MDDDHIYTLESIGDEEHGGNYKNRKVEAANKGKNNNNQSLQLDFFDIFLKKQEAAPKATHTAASPEEDSDQLVSLSLGISPKGQTTMDIEKRNINKTEKKNIRENENLEEGLALGLDINFDPLAQIEGTNNPSFDKEGKGQELTEIWPPSKVLKTMRTVDNKSEASQLPSVKKARVSIRARCDTQTMNDGCQWRKYGQKIAKGNPCPRAYYRCTVSPSCPVRKQVQRCAEDMSILITTYEGTHNHPLPTSATAMASTTSAAASMLQSPSLTSSLQGLTNNSSDTLPLINSSDSYYNLNALNFTSTSSHQFSRPQQLYLPSSISTSNNSHPTITLDLTTPPITPSHLGKFSPGFSSIQKHSPTNLNFSKFSPLQSSIAAWSSPYSGSMTQNRKQNGSFMKNNGKQAFQGHLYQPNHMNNKSHAIIQQDYSIAAITTNPKFQSAIAAALTTYVGNGSSAIGGVRENHNAALKLRLGGDMSYTKNTVHSSIQNQNGIGSSSALNAQQGNIIFPLPQYPSKSSFNSNKSNQFLEQRK